MLDPWIIEEIRRREEEERLREERRPHLEIQIETPRYPPEDRDRNERPGERGVVIVDFTI